MYDLFKCDKINVLKIIFTNPIIINIKVSDHTIKDLTFHKIKKKNYEPFEIFKYLNLENFVSVDD